jgi:5-methylcytosine-specific restriction endonuclease McrA
MKDKSLKDFSKKKSNKDGLQRRCKSCMNEYLAVWRSNNPDNYSKWVSENENSVSIRMEEWRKNNIERTKNTYNVWRKNNMDKVNFKSAKRRASKMKRTPPWISAEQLLEIKEFYILAKELQWLSDPTDPLSVDHIIPLQGENVSGLHVPWNLQILPKSQNSSKGNRV